jgi:hypothetical protein
MKRPKPNGVFGKAHNLNSECQHTFGPFLLTDDNFKEVVPAGFVARMALYASLKVAAINLYGSL